MKKKPIWTVATIMGLSFLALLFLQLKYIEEMARMKKEQFDESVNRALYQASRNLELNETLRYLEKDINEIERKAYSKDSTITDAQGNISQSHQYSVADTNAQGDDHAQRQELHIGHKEVDAGDCAQPLYLSEIDAR